MRSRYSTLADAGHYIAGLSPALQKRPQWQAAAQALLRAPEMGGPAMFARIGMMRALNHGRPERARRKLYGAISRVSVNLII